MNVNGKLDLANIIVTTWAPSFYDTLKNKLMLVDIFRSEYEGVISKRGDKVKVNSMNLAAAETLTNDKTKFKSTALGFTQYELTVNRQTVHAVDITDLAALQSESFMEKLRSEMAYQIMLKMEQETYEYYKSVVPAGNKLTVTSASDYAAIDIGKQRTAMSKKKIALDGRYNILSPDYYGDLLGKSQITSSDYVEGRPFQDQVIPKILNFKTAEHDLLTDDTGIFFHASGLHTVVQRGLNMQVVSKVSNNELAFMVVADIVWDLKEFDTNRLFQITG
jgi:hypothetical protein